MNDSIVLVDFINSHVQAGMPLAEALIESGRRRFRPVLLTSLTTVAGLAPILTERSQQAQILIPMANSLCFGLILSTTLVLLLVPVFYSIYGRAVLAMQPAANHALDVVDWDPVAAAAESNGTVGAKTPDEQPPVFSGSR